MGNWAHVGDNETLLSNYVSLQDERGVLNAKHLTGKQIDANATRVKDFFAVIVKSVPGSLRSGFIDKLDFSVFLEAYGGYSSSATHGSSRDFLLLPSLPNVTNPALRLDINNNAPTYFEQFSPLPGSLVAQTTVYVVTGPAYYVRANMVLWLQSGPQQLSPQPFDVYNATISFSLAYANGTNGHALRTVGSPAPAWGLLFYPSAELVDISATVEVCCLIATCLQHRCQLPPCRSINLTIMLLSTTKA